MYQLTLTAQQYGASTTYNLSLWQKLPNGKREPLALCTSLTPGPTDGLFETTIDEFVQVALAHFAGLSENIG